MIMFLNDDVELLQRVADRLEEFCIAPDPRKLSVTDSLFMANEARAAIRRAKRGYPPDAARSDARSKK